MGKLDCDIIRDLIPSYVDEICTKATRECVEEHMRECTECRQVMEACKNSMLSDNKAEQRGLDGFKKIKEQMKIQNLLMVLVVVFMIALGLGLFGFRAGMQLPFGYSVLFAVCVLISVYTGIGYTGKEKPGLTEYILCALLLAMDIYFVGICLLLVNGLKMGAETLLGMELSRTGPFLSCQFGICFIVQIAIFFYYVRCAAKQDKNCGWMFCINMMGVFLILDYEVWLFMMSDMETMKAGIWRGAAEMAAVCILGIIAGFARGKIVNKKLQAKLKE